MLSPTRRNCFYYIFHGISVQYTWNDSSIYSPISWYCYTATKPKEDKFSPVLGLLISVNRTTLKTLYVQALWRVEHYCLWDLSWNHKSHIANDLTRHSFAISPFKGSNKWSENSLNSLYTFNHWQHTYSHFSRLHVKIWIMLPKIDKNYLLYLLSEKT